MRPPSPRLNAVHIFETSSKLHTLPHFFMVASFFCDPFDFSNSITFYGRHRYRFCIVIYSILCVPPPPASTRCRFLKHLRNGIPYNIFSWSLAFFAYLTILFNDFTSSVDTGRPLGLSRVLPCPHRRPLIFNDSSTPNAYFFLRVPKASK